MINNQRDITQYVNSGITLRDVQTEYLHWVQENIDNYDVFVAQKAVASGKSICATAMARWLNAIDRGNVALITPTKILQDQYTNEFDWIPVLKGMSEYPCLCNPGKSCRDYKRNMGACCTTENIEEMTGESGTCGYLKARAVAADAVIALFNFHSYSFCQMFKSNLIIDEGHNAIGFLYGLFEANLWKCEVEYPDDLEITPVAIAEWMPVLIHKLDEEKKNAILNKNDNLAEKLENQIDRYEKLRIALKVDAANMIVKKKRDTYKGSQRKLKGTEQEYIFIKPLKIDKIGPYLLWPKEKVRKIFFLSATINAMDMEILGLHNKRIGYFEGESPIPAERRRIIFHPLANMSYRNRNESIPVIIDGIIHLANKRPDEKGLIHCTYATAMQLRNKLSGDPRFLFHTKFNKQEVYERFKASKQPKILVASGMSEGIDLPHDAARWQILTQIMWPHLSDEVNVWRLQNAPHLYHNDTVRQVEQGSGRVCRAPTDKGDTYIFDQQFWRLWKLTHTDRIQRGEQTMWSKTFQDALVWPKER